MMANQFRDVARKVGAPVAVVLSFLLCTGALGGDCNQDIANLTKKRQGIIDQLNHLAKGSKNQLDPIASCPKLRALVAAEKEFIAYLTKNKDWCSVPDEALANISASAAKSGTVADQACKVAAQVKKAQEQQATDALRGSPSQKLPTGPL